MEDSTTQRLILAFTDLSLLARDAEVQTATSAPSQRLLNAYRYSKAQGLVPKELPVRKFVKLVRKAGKTLHQTVPMSDMASVGSAPIVFNIPSTSAPQTPTPLAPVSAGQSEPQRNQAPEDAYTRFEKTFGWTGTKFAGVAAPQGGSNDEGVDFDAMQEIAFEQGRRDALRYMQANEDAYQQKMEDVVDSDFQSVEGLGAWGAKLKRLVTGKKKVSAESDRKSTDAKATKKTLQREASQLEEEAAKKRQEAAKIGASSSTMADVASGKEIPKKFDFSNIDKITEEAAEKMATVASQTPAMFKRVSPRGGMTILPRPKEFNIAQSSAELYTDENANTLIATLLRVDALYEPQGDSIAQSPTPKDLRGVLHLVDKNSKKGRVLDIPLEPFGVIRNVINDVTACICKFNNPSITKDSFYTAEGPVPFRVMVHASHTSPEGAIVRKTRVQMLLGNNDGSTRYGSIPIFCPGGRGVGIVLQFNPSTSVLERVLLLSLGKIASMRAITNAHNFAEIKQHMLSTTFDSIHVEPAGAHTRYSGAALAQRGYASRTTEFKRTKDDYYGSMHNDAQLQTLFQSVEALSLSLWPDVPMNPRAMIVGPDYERFFAAEPRAAPFSRWDGEREQIIGHLTDLQNNKFRGGFKPRVDSQLLVDFSAQTRASASTRIGKGIRRALKMGAERNTVLDVLVPNNGKASNIRAVLISGKTLQKVNADKIKYYLDRSDFASANPLPVKFFTVVTDPEKGYPNFPSGIKLLLDAQKLEEIQESLKNGDMVVAGMMEPIKTQDRNITEPFMVALRMTRREDEIVIDNMAIIFLERQ